MLMKRSLAALALLAGSLALMAPTAQAAHVSVGIGVGLPGYVVPPPVVVVPPPYYGPPAYYAAPEYYPPYPVVAVGPGYWWYDGYGHRHWRRR